MNLAAIDPNLAVAFIVGILGSGGVGSWYIASKKVQPEMEAVGNKSLIEVNAELRTEIGRQSKMIDRLREQNDRQEQVIEEQDKALVKARDHTRALTSELTDLESRHDELGA